MLFLFVPRRAKKVQFARIIGKWQTTNQYDQPTEATARVLFWFHTIARTSPSWAETRCTNQALKGKQQLKHCLILHVLINDRPRKFRFDKMPALSAQKRQAATQALFDTQHIVIDNWQQKVPFNKMPAFSLSENEVLRLRSTRPSSAHYTPNHTATSDQK